MLSGHTKGTFKYFYYVFKLPHDTCQMPHDSSFVFVVLAFVQVSDGRGGILEGNPEGEALLLTFSICKLLIKKNK